MKPTWTWVKSQIVPPAINETPTERSAEEDIVPRLRRAVLASRADAQEAADTIIILRAKVATLHSRVAELESSAKGRASAKARPRKGRYNSAPRGSVAERVREHRFAHGWTQAQLAEASGLSRMYITYIETGRKMPSPKALAKIFSTGNVLVRGYTAEEVLAELPEEVRLAAEDESRLIDLRIEEELRFWAYVQPFARGGYETAILAANGLPALCEAVARALAAGRECGMCDDGENLTGEPIYGKHVD